MSKALKRYRVSGTDAESDLHGFATNDRARAEAMVEQMAENLTDVELHDVEAREPYEYAPGKWTTPI